MEGGKDLVTAWHDYGEQGRSSEGERGPLRPVYIFLVLACFMISFSSQHVVAKVSTEDTEVWAML